MAADSLAEDTPDGSVSKPSGAATRVVLRYVPRASGEHHAAAAPSHHQQATVVVDNAGQQMAATGIAAGSNAPHIDGYQINGELGRGGSGVVYSATHLTLKRAVALKVIFGGEHLSAEERGRFRLEAETIARLSHAGIVQIYEIGEQEGLTYLALELVEQGGLHKCLGDGPLDAHWAASVVRQLARTIDFCHRNGIVHRDLKPENVLVASDCPSPPPAGDGAISWHGSADATGYIRQAPVPQLKLTDFGLAKQMDDDSQLTRSGVMMGTPAYMAPEQARSDADAGREIGPGADIHALGAILYRLLTGRPPFFDRNVFEALRQVREDDPAPPAQFHPGLADDLETICLKCLMKEPQQRYRSAADLAEDLDLYLHDEPINARPLSWADRIGRWARRRPLLGSTAALVAGFGLMQLGDLLFLKVPGHDAFFHARISGLLLVMVLMAVVVQRMIDTQRWALLGRVVFITVGIVLTTLTLAVDRGPQSAPLLIYQLAIPLSALLLPRPWMLWFTATLAALGYGVLCLVAWYFKPQYMVSGEYITAFLVGLVLTAVTVHMILRRARGPA